MTYNELVNLKSGKILLIQCHDNKVRRYKITSIQLMKRSKELRIGLKHGLYCYDKLIISPDENLHFIKGIKQ